MAVKNLPLKTLETESERGSASSTTIDTSKLDELNRLAGAPNFNNLADYNTAPDFTRAVKMVDAIYRINVPGYFYRHSINFQRNSLGKSGVIVAPYPTMIDRYIGLGIHDVGAYEFRNSLIGSKEDPPMITYGYNDYARATMSVSIKDATGAVLAKSESSKFFAAAIYPQLRKGVQGVMGEHMSYSVNEATGKSGEDYKRPDNKLIPIVPGVGGKVSPVYGMERVVCDRKSCDYGGHDDDREGLFEGAGTYAYYSADTTASLNASFWFVPCVCAPTSVQPITLVRHVDKVYGYDLPSYPATIVIGFVSSLQKISEDGWYSLKPVQIPNEDYAGASFEHKAVRTGFHSKFMQMFNNVSMTGHTDKFIVQRYDESKIPELISGPTVDDFVDVQTNDKIIEVLNAGFSHLELVDPKVQGA